VRTSNPIFSLIQRKKLLVPSSPRKMTPKYVPPSRVSADVDPEDGFNDFRAQLEEVAKHPGHP
jgi:hypothetical protein